MAENILIDYEDNVEDAAWGGSFLISLLCKGEKND